MPNHDVKFLCLREDKVKMFDMQVEHLAGDNNVINIGSAKPSTVLEVHVHFLLDVRDRLDLSHDCNIEYLLATVK